MTQFRRGIGIVSRDSPAKTGTVPRVLALRGTVPAFAPEVFRVSPKPPEVFPISFGTRKESGGPFEAGHAIPVSYMSPIRIRPEVS